MNTQDQPQIPLNTNFFVNAFARAHADQQDRDDRDTVSLHVSDIVDCGRAVWARRNGREMIQPDNDTMRKFGFGKSFEDQVDRALEYSGHYYTEQDVIDVEVEGVRILGHVDFVIRDNEDKETPIAVVEVKTTTFFPTMVAGKRVRVAPSETKYEHRIQAATYAMLLGCERFCVLTVCRDSGLMAEHWFSTANYVDDIRKAMRATAAVSKVGSPEPKHVVPPAYTINAKTGKSWRCTYCPYTACERNTNPAALAVPA